LVLSVGPIFDNTGIRAGGIFQVPKSWQAQYPGPVTSVPVTVMESSDASVDPFDAVEVGTRFVKQPVCLRFPWTGFHNQRWSDREVVREPFIKIGPDDVRLAAGFGGATSSRSWDCAVVDVRDTVDIA